MIDRRHIWERAIHNLASRYAREHGVSMERAQWIISDKHEAIGAEMDRIEGGMR